jgi:ABC-type ATPase with predicted acetyltransferase domain
MTTDIFAFYYDSEPVGLIVYSIPVRSFMLTNFYLTDEEREMFENMSGDERRLVSGNNISIISRVVTHPTFRGIGLASHMIRETIPMINKRLVIISSVMSNYVSFCEAAGMTHIVPKSSVKFTRFMEFFERNNIDKERIYFDNEYRKETIKSLKSNKQTFEEFLELLKNYIKKYFSSLDYRG